MQLTHIIYPEFAKGYPTLKLTQAVIFETFKIAKNRALKDLIIDQVAIGFPGFEKNIPNYFKKANNLKQSILYVNNSDVRQRLPLINEILEIIYDASNADYLIFTDSSIALFPDFYLEIKGVIESGLDSFAISSRRINGNYNTINELQTILKEKGEKQSTADCYVFKRSIFKKFNLGDACFGAKWSNQIMISNMMANDENFKFFDNLHITFHIGNPQYWKNEISLDFDRHNERELMRILRYFMNTHQIKNRSKLFDFYKYQLNSYYLFENKDQNNHPEYQINSDIVGMNTPNLEAQADNDILYHNEFRKDGSWYKYDKQIIRQDPVFVVGYPRSGTTLVQSLIATQDDFVTLHETHFFNSISKNISKSNEKINISELSHLLTNIRERISLSTGAEKHIRKLVNSVGISKKMLFEIIIADNLMSQYQINKSQQQRWIEKTPDHALFIKDISAFYPDARFIFVVRHPEKAIISRKKHFIWNKEYDWPVEKHINMWTDTLENAESYSISHPGTILFVRMEDVVKDPKKEVNKICDFLDVPFQKEKLNNYKNISKLTTYQWETWKSDAAKNISAKKVNRETEHIPVIDRIILDKILNKYLNKFHYKIDYNDVAKKGKLDEVFKNQLLKNHESLSQLKDFIKIKEKEINLSKKRIKEKEESISKLKTNIANKLLVEQKQQNQLNKNQSKIIDIQKSNTEKDQIISNLKNNYDELLIEKNQMITNLKNSHDDILIEKNQMIANFQNLLTEVKIEKEDKANKLIEKTNQLTNVINSNSWKIGQTITKPIRFLRDILQKIFKP